MLDLFFNFLFISAFTLGGGYAMVPVMEKKLIGKKLISEKEFYDIFSIAQSLPGPIAFNTARLLGRKIKGFYGAVVCGIAVIIPPFFAIIIASSIINLYKDNPYVISFFKGIYAAIIGMIFSVLYKAIKNQSWNYVKIIFVFSAVAILLLNESFLLLIFIFSVIANYFYESGRGKKC